MNKFCSIILYFSLGCFPLIQAKITVRITLRDPKAKDVFNGDTIRLKCESSESEGRAVNVSWHLKRYDGPAITNTSSTNIITWKTKDNKTISMLTLNVGIRPATVFQVICTVKNGIKNDAIHIREPFQYIPDSNIPKISVKVPQAQTVAEGTRRHVLQCEVSSNVKIDKLNIKWLFGGQELATTAIKDSTSGKLFKTLQCLTEKDLGNYTCNATTTMYSRVWQDSGVTLLTGDVPGVNIGMKNLPSFCLHVIAILLSMWRTVV